MNKKEYEKPAMRVIILHQRAHLLTGSGYGKFTTTSTNLVDDDGFEFVGSDEGYTGDAR
jgi:hypothetical protein